jgi:methylmalonyl-CoA mutase N-terminal domain/subunit
VRGRQKTEKNNWFIRQGICNVDSVNQANKKATDAVAKGANSIGFVFQETGINMAQLAELLKGIDLANVEVNFTCKGSTTEFVEVLLAYVKENKVDAINLKGSIAYDPLMCIARKGKYYSADPMANAVNMVKLLKALPNFKAINIKGYLFEDAVSSISQE